MPDTPFVVWYYGVIIIIFVGLLQWQSAPMDKNLTVYPISSGDMLSIFSNEDFGHVRIMDMSGNVVYDASILLSQSLQVDIGVLTRATYIVEVEYNNKKTARSVFVKM